MKKDDLVRVVDRSNKYYGELGRVTSTGISIILSSNVAMPDGNVFNIYDEYLQIVNATNEFSMGDKVKVVSVDTDWKDYAPILGKYVGLNGTVSIVNAFYVRVKFSSGLFDSWNFHPSWLKKVVEPTVNKTIVPEKKKTRLIEVDYKESQDGNYVTITAIRNLLSAPEIHDKYGFNVWDEYGYTAAKRISRRESQFVLLLKDSSILGHQGITKLPYILSTSMFAKLINYMREAGEIFTNIVRKDKKKKEERKAAEAKLKADAEARANTIHTITI